MRISKEKLDRLKKGSRRAGRAIAAGGKSTVYEGGAGVAACYAARLLDNNFEFARNKPWAKGAALIAVGHMLKKKKSLGSVGAAIVGAGGYALGLHLQNRKAATATTSTTATAPAAAPAETQGVYPDPYEETSGVDTGMVFTSAVSRRAA